MNDLSNTIAHILEHRKRLEHSNEALTKPEAIVKQYVILPILRTLGWNDTNLVSIEVMPEYKVDRKSVDYALTVEQIPKVFIECKKWEDPLTRHEEQICFYAYSKNVPLAVITNGRIWRFYLSGWQATSLSDRIFCEIDIEDRENAVSNLEKYLLKSNVESGETEVDAEIALEEKGETDSSGPSLINSKTDSADDAIDKKSVETEITVAGEWTIERVSLLSEEEEVGKSHTAKFSEERCKVFYRRIAEIQNLIEAKGWRLKPPKLNKESCRFFLMDKGVTRVTRVFGILLHTHLPHGRPKGRNGEKIPDISIKSNPPRIFVRITEKEARQLERQHGCEFWGISENHVYYDILENISELLPVLEFAYNKHLGN